MQPLVVRQLGATALFAAKFRENAARSLLLPKRRPGMRAPLWQQRKRAADLLAVASRYGSFPVLLETYRECLRDVFDMPALVQTLGDVRSRRVRIVTVDSERPSPFAASLLFSYVASFLYDGDAPLAERRAQALAVDQAQLRELLGDAELRELLDADALDAVERQLQRIDPRFHARTLDGVHDMLIALGDLTADELAARTVSPEIAASGAALVKARRALALRIAGEPRFVAVEDSARYRDALGIPLPPGVPEALLEPVRDPLGDLALRYARTHAPFTAAEFGSRYGLATDAAEHALLALTAEGRLLEGEFRPGGTRREWTDAGVLRMIRRRSLAKLRKEVEPVDPAALGRFSVAWHGLVKKRHGADALLDVIEQLQGAPLPASILESEILAARLEQYDAGDLDAIVAAGEVVWVGVEPLGDRDGRVALYLADHLPRLLPASVPTPHDFSGRERAIVECLGSRGASFFAPLHDAVGGGYPGETVDAIWNLVWMGIVTNDTVHALRGFTRARRSSKRAARRDAPAFRSRRLVPPSAEGRWSLVDALRPAASVPDAASRRRPSRNSGDTTKWATALAQQLLTRHGVVTREALVSESIPGGFGTMYPVLKAMEEAGRIRRGYFVAGLGATQFAMPGALDLLRSVRDGSEEPEVVAMAATDPANPYGTTLKWPGGSPQPAGDPSTGTEADAKGGRGPTRTVGATVVLVDGALVAYLARGDRQLVTWLPEAEPQRSRAARALAGVLIARARSGGDAPRGMLIEEIDGTRATLHPLAEPLVEAGFAAGAMGLQGRLARTFGS